MTPMPYVVQVGSVLNGISNYWEQLAGGGAKPGRQHMHECLEDCLNPNISFAHCRGFVPRTVAGYQHIWEHWLGYPLGTYNAANPAPGVQPAASSQTGHWIGWKGDANAVLKASFAKALQVALGYQDGQNVNQNTQRWWPIEIIWVCGSPLFQGYVEWRARRSINNANPNTDGQVVLILSTPPVPYPLLATPTSGVRTADYASSAPVAPEPPLDLRRDQGLVIIGEEDVENRVKPVGPPGNFDETNYVDSGSVLPEPPTHLFWTYGGIQSVQIAEADGGVLAAASAPAKIYP